MSLATAAPGKNAPEDINVVIEIPMGGAPVKYEIDKDTGGLLVDRFMGTAMYYPCNYGFIPSTLGEDDDPLDVLVVTPVPLQHNCMIKCRPVGVLNMTDESGGDAKLLAVPVDKLTPLYKDVKEATDLPESLLNQVQHFFEHYKDLEPGKWVKVENWDSAEAAKKEVVASIERHNNG